MSVALELLPGMLGLAAIAALILAPVIAERMSGIAQQAADDGEAPRG